MRPGLQYVFLILLSWGIATLLSWSQINGSINFFIVKRALQEQSQESAPFALQKQVLSPFLVVLCMWLVSISLLLS